MTNRQEKLIENYVRMKVRKMLKEDKINEGTVPVYEITWKMSPRSNQTNVLFAYSDSSTAKKVVDFLNKTKSKLGPNHTESIFGVQVGKQYID